MLRTTLLAGLILSALALNNPASAQPPLDRDVAFKMMADPGRWVEVNGKANGDGTFFGKEVEVFSLADTSNMEEPQVYGAIEKLDRRRSTMTVLGYRVYWDQETTIKDADKHRILSSKLENGMPIKVQGFLRNNGMIYADKLKLKKVKMKNGKIKIKEKLVGPVTVLDAREGWIRILNTDIQVRHDAKLLEVMPDIEEDDSE